MASQNHRAFSTSHSKTQTVLRKQFIGYLSTKLTQLFKPTRVIVGQLVVIKIKQPQYGDMKVSNVMHIFNS